MLRTLWESSALAPIAAAADAAGVTIELFGSVASRAQIWHTLGRPDYTLFDLASHMSDIDLGHSGSSEKTPLVRAALEAFVPMASWFRWSILDRDQMREMEAYKTTNIRIPLREFRIGTTPLPDGEAEDPISRAFSGEFDFYNTGSFASSPRAQYDSEASAALIYFDALLDLVELRILKGDPLERHPVDLTFRAVADGCERIKGFDGKNRWLALTRLWYLFSRSVARIRATRLKYFLFEHYFSFFPIIDLLDANGYPASLLINEPREAIITSNLLGESKFRLPLRTNELRFRGCEGYLAELLRESFGSDGLSEVMLAEGNEAIAAVTELEVTGGESVSAIAEHPLAQEFVHIIMPLPKHHTRFRQEQLTAVAFGHKSGKVEMLPQFAVVFIPSIQLPWQTLEVPQAELASQCTIRMNLTSVVSKFDKIDVVLVKDASSRLELLP